MTADEAAATWFRRGAEIINQFSSFGPSEDLHNEAGVAANGAAALLQNRWNELSNGARLGLQRLVDAMADIHARSLDAAQDSPLKESTMEFAQIVGHMASMGWKGVVDAFSKLPDYIPDPGEFKIGLLLVVGLLILVLAKK